MRALVIPMLVAVILCAPCRSEGQWLRLTTPHFELFTTAGERSGRAGILYFETVRQFFIDSGIAANLPPERLRIVAFRGDKEFRPYAPNEVATAFFTHCPGRDYIVLSQLGFLYYPTAVHEYTHFVFRQRSTKLPVWLNEGLAELFSTLRPEGKHVLVGDAIGSHLVRLNHNQLIDLETLFAAGAGSNLLNERSHAGLFYSESWALVHMLFTSPAYAPRFPTFWKAIASGGDSAAAVRQAY